MASRAETTFVEGPPDDAAGDRQGRQAVQVLQRPDASRGDHRGLDALGQGLGRGQVRAFEHAVARDVGVDDRRQRQVVELLGQRRSPRPSRPRASPRSRPGRRGRRGPGRAGPGYVSAIARNQSGSFSAWVPDDHPFEPGVEPGGDRRLVADAAAELAGDLDPARGSRRTGLDVDRPAGLGPVEVDQVDAGRPFRLPACGHRRGIVAEDRLPVVIPLPEADAQPSPQVDGRDHLHGSSPKRQRSFNEPNVSPPRGHRKDRPSRPASKCARRMRTARAGDSGSLRSSQAPCEIA